MRLLEWAFFSVCSWYMRGKCGLYSNCFITPSWKDKLFICPIVNCLLSDKCILSNAHIQTHKLTLILNLFYFFLNAYYSKVQKMTIYPIKPCSCDHGHNRNLFDHKKIQYIYIYWWKLWTSDCLANRLFFLYSSVLLEMIMKNIVDMKNIIDMDFERQMFFTRVSTSSTHSVLLCDHPASPGALQQSSSEPLSPS